MKLPKALLIIDMQNDSFTPAYPCYDREGVVNRINILSRKFREAGYPVIHVQHDGTLQNEYVPGTSGWALIPDLEVSGSDVYISKIANDIFYKTELQDVLSRLKIHDLVITGAATDFCIDSSIQSALTKEYAIVVACDGHTASDRPYMSAQKMIAHYNWVWENLIPTKGRIVVKAADAIEL